MPFERPFEKQIVVVLIPSRKYGDQLAALMISAAEFGKKVCYVSLGKPYHTILEILKRNKIDSKKFFIIDAVTPIVTLAPRAGDGVSFVSSPSAVTELSIRIGDAHRRHKFDVMIFDSISTLMMHARATEILEFIHALITRLRSFGCNATFPILLEDMGSTVVRDLSMLADVTKDMSKKRRKRASD